LILLIILRLESLGELTMFVPEEVVIFIPAINCKKLCLKAISEFAVKGVPVLDYLKWYVQN